MNMFLTYATVLGLVTMLNARPSVVTVEKDTTVEE